MLESLIISKNKLIDWFIPDGTKINDSELYAKRRFIEAVMVIFVASFSGFLLNAFGIRDSFPSELAMINCIAILFMHKNRIRTLFIANIFVGFFYIALTYGVMNNSTGITFYFRWYIAIPMFSMLFINKNSTIFWSLLIILSHIGLFFYEFPINSPLDNQGRKLYFFTNTTIFYIILIMLIYVYSVGKEFISKKLMEEQKEIKKQAADLIIMQRELIEKNNVLKTYAHVVSHDLKSPIRSIRSFAELLKTTLLKKDIDDALINQQLSFINDNAIQMEELVSDILRYAELNNDRSREFRETNLNILLNQVISTLSDQSAVKNILIYQIDLPIIRLLPTQTKQIFQNLISNSLKFVDESRALKIEIFEEDHKDYVLFKIKDNGIGIRQEHLKDIFLPFKRFNSPSKYNGSGIGLANCAKVVKRHRGKIWAESVEGEGSTISFTLSKNMFT
jgi:signal transduction histidine kinase